MFYGEKVRNRLLRKVRRGLAPLLLAGLAGAGCSVGAYPVDYFQEMHYSQAFRIQEPQRLDVPGEAVPFAGAGVARAVDAPKHYRSMAFTEMAGVENPLPKNTETMSEARNLFRINCTACHGQNGKGLNDTPLPVVASLFSVRTIDGTADGVKVAPPADFSSDVLAMSRSPGELFWIINHGTASLPGVEPGRGHMPAFGKLLSAEQQWALVYMVEECRTGGEYCPAPAPR